MSKKHKNHDKVQNADAPVPPAPACAPAAEMSAAQPAAKDASMKYFFIFWGIIVLAAAAAWLAAIYFPTVRESLIERWIMAGLAAALSVFLFFYR